MEEPRWSNGAEEYRAIQGLVRAGRPREALDRAINVLTSGRIGRRHAARLHSLVCRLHTEDLQQVSPEAALHGEEAVRLAELISDVWIKCEALNRLADAYLQMGDVERAKEAVATIGAEVEKNEGAIDGGTAALYMLRAQVADAEGDAAASLHWLEVAEGICEDLYPEWRERIRQHRMEALLEQGEYAQARRLLESMTTPVEGKSPETELIRAWLALAEARPGEVLPLVEQVLEIAEAEGQFGTAVECMALRALVEEMTNATEARRLARQALQRSFTAGRLDLARRFQRRLAHLLG